MYIYISYLTKGGQLVLVVIALIAGEPVLSGGLRGFCGCKREQ